MELLLPVRQWTPLLHTLACAFACGFTLLFAFAFAFILAFTLPCDGNSIAPAVHVLRITRAQLLTAGTTIGTGAGNRQVRCWQRRRTLEAPPQQRAEEDGVESREAGLLGEREGGKTGTATHKNMSMKFMS